MPITKRRLSSLMTKKTRFKMAMVLCIFCMALTIYAINKDANDVAGQALAALMVIAPAYILGDSYRKSEVNKT